MQLKILRCLFLFLILFEIMGCANIKSLKKDIKMSFNYSSDSQLLEKGYNEFQKGEILKASKIFEQLNKDNIHKTLRSQALYGLSCCKLILAKNCDEFSEAYNIWAGWINFSKGKLKKDDPKMLEPLLNRLAKSGFFLIDEMQEDKSSQTSSSQIYNQTEINRINKNKESKHKKKEPDNSANIENTSFKKMYFSCHKSSQSKDKEIQSKDKEIKQLKNDILKSKKDIEVLKSQLSALEVIHQKIQEKKKGIDK